MRSNTNERLVVIMREMNGYWLDKLPDLNLNKYQAFAENDIDGLIKQQRGFVRQWVSICELYELTMHFVIAYSGQKINGKRLDIGIVFRGEKQNLDAIEPLLLSSSIKDYYTLRKDNAKISALNQNIFPSMATLTKNVRALPPRQGTNPFWFVQNWEINEEARLIELVKIMESIGNDCAYRVDLFPGDLVEKSRNAFKNSMESIRKMLGYGDNGFVALTEQKFHVPRDENAEDALRQFEDWVEKIETSPHLSANIYAFSNSRSTSELLLHTAGSETIEKGNYTVLPVPTQNGARLFDGMMKSEAITPTEYTKDEAFPAKLRFWSNSYTFEEIAPFVKLPALYEGEVVQLPKETAADPEMTGLLLGRDVNGHDIKFPVSQLNKHAFICGVPGSGKTNTMLHLTSTLWKEFNIPFLVLEPAKKEYRALLNDPEMKEVMLFSPNAGTVLPIAINPFEFPLGLTLSEHISALMQVFSGAFEVYGPVWFYLNRAIELAYYSLGWKAETINNGSLDYPVLSEIIEIYKSELESSTYDGELKGNLNSFLQVRLGGLMTRELSEIFDVSQSSLQPEDWLKKPAVIELEALESGACNFFILLLCTLIRETLKANPNEETAHKLRHVIFIEEAHNLIAPNTEQQSQEVVNPKVSATAYIVKMLAEVRALNEGIVIADQLPSVIASEVMKNTGLKIVHRMTAEDDRAMVGSTMSATQAQLEHLGTYNPGEALLFYEGLQLPFKGKIKQWEDGVINTTPKGNSELSQLMMGNNFYKEVMGYTIDSLCFKLIDVGSTDVGRFLKTISARGELFENTMSEIESDTKEDYSDSLDEISKQLSETFILLGQCKKIIFDMQDSLVSLKTRFPTFSGRFDNLGRDTIEQIRSYNSLFDRLMSIRQKLKSRGYA